MGGQGCEDRARLENGTVKQDLGERMELGAQLGLGTGQILEGGLVLGDRAKVEDGAFRKGQGLQETNRKLRVYMIEGQERAKGKDLGEATGRGTGS